MGERTCKVGICSRPVHKLGWCSGHYQRVRKYGSPLELVPLVERAKARKIEAACIYEACERPAIAFDWCRMHYKRWWRTGSPDLQAKLTPAEKLASRTVRRDNGCLEWTGPPQDPKLGYGRVSVDGQMWSTHRLAYTLAVGSIPDGLIVRHKCDNPPCCDPDHLELGTHQDNCDDMLARDRRSKDIHGRLLTWDDVDEIRRLCREGVRRGEVAEMFGVSPGMVWQIRREFSWKPEMRPPRAS